MTHLKRNSLTRTWPISRKGSKFIAKPKANQKKGIPILFVLRDMLKITQNKKEAKRVLHEEKVLLNARKIKDVRNSVLLFDIISIVPSKEFYQLSLTDNGKFKLEKIDKKDSNKKIAKVSNKKIIKKGKIQINLEDGKNFIQSIKCNTGDSVIIDLEKRKIEKCLPVKKGNNAIIIAGKHSGKKGKIEEIDEKHQMITIKTKENKLNVLMKQMMVIE